MIRTDLGQRPSLREFLGEAGSAVDGPGARLAVLRADMSLRWETGEKVGVEWYLERYSDLGEDTIVALIYEEFCLREEEQENPVPAEYLSRFPQVAEALGRVLDIHELVGSGTTATAFRLSSDLNGDQRIERGVSRSRTDDRRFLPGRRTGTGIIRAGLPGQGAPVGRSAGGPQSHAAGLA